MFFKEWEVLLVDDEPDVLSVSKLAMKRFEVYGLPLKIHTAGSKAAAVEILRQSPALLPTLTVAFIDVVMESDTAGLELCEHIREKLNNKITQLFIRTGQPGVAPERSVIDRYDINGYFTKVEATEDKLYTLIKSGVRQYVWTWFAMSGLMLLDNMIAVSDSRAKLAEGMQYALKGFHMLGDSQAESHDVRGSLRIGDATVASMGMDSGAAGDLRAQLSKQPGVSLGPQGDKYVVEGHDLLIALAPRASRPEAYFVFRTTFVPPEYMISMLHRFLTCVVSLWQRAG
jgi:CheY-like chemotaxis protein